MLLPVIRIVGLVQAYFGGLMLLPALVAFYDRDYSSLTILLVSAAVIILTGLVIAKKLQQYNQDLTPHDGVLLVPLTWLWLPLISCVPLFFILNSAGRSLDFSHVYFEAVSSLTTTGNTVLTNLDDLPLAMHFWRTMMSWLGGLGVIILAVAVLPLMGAGATRLLRIEMTGPIKDSKLTPRISSTAKGIWGIYVGFSALCALAYWLAGMSPLDAIMHMFSTISLGGLTPHDGSLAYFKSELIELIAIVFMTLGSVSFALYFVALRKRSIRKVFESPEAKATFLTLLVCGYLASIILWIKTDTPLAESIRLGVFHVISLGTTTGFTSVDYMYWPVFIPVMMLILSGIATGAGSTGGGIKMIRMLILLKVAQYEIKRMAHPRAVRPVTLGDQVVDQPAIFSVLAFMLVYAATIIILSMLLMLTDVDMVTAFTAIIASVHCLGVGFGDVGPSGSFANFDSIQIWTCTFAMLLGRLEMLSFLAFFMPSFWRK